jgi:transcriptional regulator with XRE-family HTH domain
LVHRLEGGSGVEELGLQLRTFRLENGWSKRATAEKLGVSIPSIIRWETGLAVPNDYNRYKIDRLLESGEPRAAKSGRLMVQLSLFPGRVPSVRQSPA